MRGAIAGQTAMSAGDTFFSKNCPVDIFDIGVASGTGKAQLLVVAAFTVLGTLYTEGFFGVQKVSFPTQLTSLYTFFELGFGTVYQLRARGFLALRTYSQLCVQIVGIGARKTEVRLIVKARETGIVALFYAEEDILGSGFNILEVDSGGSIGSHASGTVGPVGTHFAASPAF